jgi:type IX secretion system PorP/SprF family membrane protein
MQKTLIISSLILFSTLLHAQQEAHYTQFMYNKQLINPAYAGQRGVETVTAIYRNQWAGFEGAPTSALLSYSMPFLSERVGVGFNLSHVTIGLQRDLNFNLAYSYALVYNEDVAIRLGVMGSVRSLGLKFDEADPINLLDPSIDNRRINEVYANAGAGIYANIGENIYAGFSVPRLIANTLGFNPDPSVLRAKEYRHFYGMVGGLIPLKEDINLTSALLIKYVQNAPLDADLNVNVEFKKFSTGLSYRFGGEGSGESLDMLLFWQASPQIGVGAAYDLSLTQVRNYTAGSFELLLMADLRRPGGRRMSNPRFFM